jgi:hypothetical protein
MGFLVRIQDAGCRMQDAGYGMRDARCGITAYGITQRRKDAKRFFSKYIIQLSFRSLCSGQAFVAVLCVLCALVGNP